MEQPNRIPLDEADFPALKSFAENILGLEVKHGTNAKNVRAQIAAAAPGMTSIPAPAAPPPSQVTVIAGDPEPIKYNDLGEAPEVRPAAVSRPASSALLHPTQDPKVKMRFHKTADKSRAKTVVLQVNGFVCRYQRGPVVDVPYRIYLAAENAKELAAVETDEINPLTGDPIMGWEQVYSYPFEVLETPRAEEIAAWEIATSEGFADRAPPVRKAA